MRSGFALLFCFFIFPVQAQERLDFVCRNDSLWLGTVCHFLFPCTYMDASRNPDYILRNLSGESLLGVAALKKGMAYPYRWQISFPQLNLQYSRGSLDSLPLTQIRELYAEKVLRPEGIDSLQLRRYCERNTIRVFPLRALQMKWKTDSVFINQEAVIMLLPLTGGNTGSYFRLHTLQGRLLSEIEIRYDTQQQTLVTMNLYQPDLRLQGTLPRIRLLTLLEAMWKDQALDRDGFRTKELENFCRKNGLSLNPR